MIPALECQDKKFSVWIFAKKANHQIFLLTIIINYSSTISFSFTHAREFYIEFNLQGNETKIKTETASKKIARVFLSFSPGASTVSPTLGSLTRSSIRDKYFRMCLFPRHLLYVYHYVIAK